MYILIRPHTETKIYFDKYKTFQEALNAMISYFYEIKRINPDIYIVKVDDNNFIINKTVFNENLTLSEYQRNLLKKIKNEKTEIKKEIQNEKVKKKETKNDEITKDKLEEIYKNLLDKKNKISNELINLNKKKEEKVEYEMDKIYIENLKKQQEEKDKEKHNIFIIDKEIYNKIEIGEIKNIPELFIKKKKTFDLLKQSNELDNEDKYWKYIDENKEKLNDDKMLSNFFENKKENATIIEDFEKI